MKARFPVGLEFVLYRCKYGYRRKIVDILTTYNATGDVVGIEYVSERLYVTGMLQERFNDTAIARSLDAATFAAFNV